MASETNGFPFGVDTSYGSDSTDVRASQDSVCLALLRD